MSNGWSYTEAGTQAGSQYNFNSAMGYYKNVNRKRITGFNIRFSLGTFVHRNRLGTNTSFHLDPKFSLFSCIDVVKEVWVGPVDPNDDFSGKSPVNLLTSQTPIEDIFSRIIYLQKSGGLNNLNDIIIPNGYGKTTNYNAYYHKRVNVKGHKYDLRITPYDELEPRRYYYDVFDLGFGNLDRWYKIKTSEFNDGYSIGFWLQGYEDNPLILIGANNVDSYNFLRYLFHQLKQ